MTMMAALTSQMAWLRSFHLVDIAAFLLIDRGWQVGGSFRFVAVPCPANYLMLLQGWVAEWLKAPVLKCARLRQSGSFPS